jgi:agmatinase
MTTHPNTFLGLPPCDPARAAAVVVALPFEKTASYGLGTAMGPRAIIESSGQVEAYDEEFDVDFERLPGIATLPPLLPDRAWDAAEYVGAIQALVARHRGRFILGLGGEHTVSYGLVRGLCGRGRLDDVTILHIDAHPDMLDRMHGVTMGHGTVMRRLWDAGCRILQVGVRSMSREEHAFIERAERVQAFYGYRLAQDWPRVLRAVRNLRGKVYLSFDVDGLDPSVIRSTGTPQPGGLSWPQAMELLRTLAGARQARLIGADVVEYAADPHPPGCDAIAARLAAKVLACWAVRAGAAR